MKNYNHIIKLFIISLLVLILILGFCGCKKTPPTEIPDQEQQDIAKEEDIPAESIDDQETTEDKISDKMKTEEEIKSELLLTLNNFFEAVKEDKEYEFFDSYTKNMVGSEEEYRNGTKSDIFYIIKESHSSWRNVKAENVIFDGNRAILTVIGDRTAEGVEYTGEEVKFKFINEEGSWKFDAYYPLDIQIISLNPEPDSEISLSEITELSISARIKSFFTITDISLQLNGEDLTLDINSNDNYEQDTFVEVPAENLITGSNQVICSAVDAVERETDHSWSFTVR